MNLQPYKVGDMESGEPIPEATYRLRINKFEFVDPGDDEWKRAHPTSKAKFQGLNVDFVVQDEGDFFGRHLFSTLTFKRHGDFMLRQLLEALEKDEDWELVDQYGNPHWSELVDGEVLAVVVIQKPTEEYPNPRNNIKKFLNVFSEAPVTR